MYIEKVGYMLGTITKVSQHKNPRIEANIARDIHTFSPSVAVLAPKTRHTTRSMSGHTTTVARTRGRAGDPPPPKDSKKPGWTNPDGSPPYLLGLRTVHGDARHEDRRRLLVVAAHQGPQVVGVAVPTPAHRGGPQAVPAAGLLVLRHEL